MEQAHPTVIVDREYGKYVDHLDVDLNVLRDHLVKKGLDDEQISETTIRFSSEVIKRFGGFVSGRCYYETNSIYVYQLEDLKFLHTTGSQTHSLTDCNTVAQNLINTTLAHEMEHRIIRATPRSDEMTAFIDQVAEKLGEVTNQDEQAAVEQWTYENNPEEIRCYTAEKDAPDGLTTIKIKPADDTHSIGI